MKLHEIAQPKMFTEGMVEPNVLLSIRNLATRGPAPSARGAWGGNHFEMMMLTRMLQMLKEGTFFQEPNPWQPNLSTNKELLDILRGMEAKQVQTIAQQVLGLLEEKDADKFAKYACPEYSWINWLDLFHAREATD